jgi:peptidoglycan/LPS O-acetylase OafA/YrhL
MHTTPQAAGPTAAPKPEPAHHSPRLLQLDGWRGLSICAVLAAHLAPVGPGSWLLNQASGVFGMALFFTLSGYLITSFLLAKPDIKSFLIRRCLRILPLAWLLMLIVAFLAPTDVANSVLRFLFLQNYHDSAATVYTAHLWSLCVELHFYFGVALLVALGGRGALRVLPWFALAVTGWRIAEGATLSILTHFRVDEILAGACLALLGAGQLPAVLRKPFERVSPWVWLVCLAAASHELTGPLNYVRPYFGALVVGSTLFQPNHSINTLLKTRVLNYLATVSYAVYVIHGPLTTGWFHETNLAVKYLIKRPITLILTFALAHVSTFYWESRWIALGQRLTSKRPAAKAA